MSVEPSRRDPEVSEDLEVPCSESTSKKERVELEKQLYAAVTSSYIEISKCRKSNFEVSVVEVLFLREWDKIWIQWQNGMYRVLFGYIEIFERSA